MASAARAWGGGVGVSGAAGDFEGFFELPANVELLDEHDDDDQQGRGDKYRHGLMSI